MPYNKITKHLIVTGFSGDRKAVPSSKEKKAEQKLKKEKGNLLNLIGNMNDTFENKVAHFKKESTRRIRKVETRMDRLRRKMETTSKELKIIYLDQVLELEQTKKNLNGMLKNYKKESEVEWDLYKQLFNTDLDKFEKMLSGFLDNFKAKQAPTNYNKGMKKL